MAFKDSTPEFRIIDLDQIDPDPAHVRRQIGEEALAGLTNAVRKLGLIHPIVVRPGAAGRYVVIAGERRRQAAIQAGEQAVPALVRPCTDDEALEVRVFENIGLGVRSALEARDMASAIQTFSARFASPEEAAAHFGRAPTWLAEATAAARLSGKVSALLDAGKIASTGAAVRIEKLSRKDEARAEQLIEQIERLPEGEKFSKKAIDEVFSAAVGRPEKPAPAAAPESEPVVAAPAAAVAEPPAAAAAPAITPPWEAAPPRIAEERRQIDTGKVKRVAELLGLDEIDEAAILARLIDDFLATRQA